MFRNLIDPSNISNKKAVFKSVYEGSGEGQCFWKQKSTNFSNLQVL